MKGFICQEKGDTKLEEGWMDNSEGKKIVEQIRSIFKVPALHGTFRVF